MRKLTKQIAISYSLLLISSSLFALNKPSLNVSLNSTYSFYPQESAIENEHHFFDSELLIDGSWQFKSLTAIFKPLFRLDNQDRVKHEIELFEEGSGTTRPAVTFEEFIISHYADNYEVSVGKQIFSWGNANLFNSTDALNPKDYLDLLDTKKIGQMALSMKYFSDNTNFHAIVLYKPTASRLPSSDNRWFLSPEPLQDALEANLGFRPDIAFGDQIDNNQTRYGLQITSSQWLIGWDIELSYFHGADNAGVYLTELQGTTFNLTRIFPEYDEYGMGFSTVMGLYEYNALLSFHDTKDNTLDDDKTVLTFGGRRTFYDSPFSDHIEDITIGLEYTYEKINKEKFEQSSSLNTGYDNGLRNTLLLMTEIKFSENTQAELEHIQNLDDNDYYFSIAVKHKINDNFKFSIRLDALGGSSDSFFGGWSNNDRLLFKTTYNF